MSTSEVAQLIDELAIAMVVIGVYLVWTRWTWHAVGLVALQSLLLGVAGIVMAAHTGREHLFVGAGLVVAVKGLALPILLGLLISRARASGEMTSAIPRRVGLLVAVGMSLAVVESFSSAPFETPLGAERALPSAVALVLLGLQTMVTRHHVVAQISGFLAIENGMALAALTAVYGMPLVVEMGVLLDVLLAMIVGFMYSRRIHEMFGDMHTTVLRELRG